MHINVCIYVYTYYINVSKYGSWQWPELSITGLLQKPPADKRFVAMQKLGRGTRKTIEGIYVDINMYVYMYV